MKCFNLFVFQALTSSSESKMSISEFQLSKPLDKGDSLQIIGNWVGVNPRLVNQFWREAEMSWWIMLVQYHRLERCWWIFTCILFRARFCLQSSGWSILSLYPELWVIEIEHGYCTQNVGHHSILPKKGGEPPFCIFSVNVGDYVHVIHLKNIRWASLSRIFPRLMAPAVRRWCLTVGRRGDVAAGGGGGVDMLNVLTSGTSTFPTG